ncbi:MAG TPA: VC0807 family protein [Actinopolymorphaceae bacterium]
MIRRGVGVVVDLAVPVALYYALRAYGVSEYLSLLAGTAFSLVRSGVSLIRGRRSNPVATFMAIMLTVSVVLSLFLGSTRFLLAKEGWITIVAGVLFIGSIRSSRPLVYRFSKPLLEWMPMHRATRGTWDELWESRSGFRRIWVVSSIIWGVVAIVEGVVHLVIAYELPIDVVPALSTVQNTVFLVLTLVVLNIYQFRAGLFRILRGYR